MKKIMLFVGLISALITACDTPKEQVTVQEVKFLTSDSLKIFADLYRVDKTHLTILLFHQAGSNARGEYGSIIPMLTSKGYNVLAVDQRTGGQLFGKYNRTIAKFHLENFEYCDAYPDQVAALDFIKSRGYTGPIVAWGSSFSAALAIKLAHERSGDLAGVLAFSPASAGPMEACNPNPLFSNLVVPALVLRPTTEMQYESVSKQMALADSVGLQTYVAIPGVHGSSMLVADRVKGVTSDTWEVVFDFLNELAL